MLKKSIMALFAGLACAGLFVVPVNASMRAGIFAEMDNAYYEEQAKHHTAGICAVLGELLTLEPEVSAAPWQENYILPEITEKIEIIETDYVAQKEFEYDAFLMAWLAVAEAEGESEYGQRLVIDSVINRCISYEFPNRPEDVIYQEGQYTSAWNGRMDACKGKVTENMINMAKEEILSQTNDDVLYFTAGHYGNFGIPMFKVGNHYFCS